MTPCRNRAYCLSTMIHLTIQNRFSIHCYWGHGGGLGAQPEASRTVKDEVGMKLGQCHHHLRKATFSPTHAVTQGLCFQRSKIPLSCECRAKMQKKISIFAKNKTHYGSLWCDFKIHHSALRNAITKKWYEQGIQKFRNLYENDTFMTFEQLSRTFHLPPSC